MYDLKRPLAILGRRKIRKDLVEAALKEACLAPGYRHPLDHIGQLQAICRDVEESLISRGLPKTKFEGAVITYVHGTHQPQGRMSNTRVHTLQISMAYRNGTWLLESIRDAPVWKKQKPFRQITLTKTSIKHIISTALSGIGSNEPDPQVLERFDLGGFLAEIATVVLPDDPSSHQKLSAIQVVDALIASGYARNLR